MILVGRSDSFIKYTRRLYCVSLFLLVWLFFSSFSMFGIYKRKVYILVMAVF